MGQRFKNLLSYKGRIGRLKYFIAIIVIGLISIFIELVAFFSILTFLFSFLQKQLPTFVLLLTGFGIAVLVVLVPCALASIFIVRRFHDLGKSGKWWFALLIPIYNIHLAIGLLTERGIVGPNQYGEDPTPNIVPDDAIHRLSQNKALRVGAIILILAFSVVGRLNTNRQKQNVMNQAAKLAVCGNNSTQPRLAKFWETYVFLPSDGASKGNFGNFSFQYPTEYGDIKNIHLAASPKYSIGIISDSLNIEINGLVNVYVNIFKKNDRTLEQILPANEFPKNIAETKKFVTDSGIAGKEMIFKIDNPSACIGYDIKAKILLDLPQKSSGDPAVIEFNADWNNDPDNSFVESIAKTFTESSSTDKSMSVSIDNEGPITGYSSMVVTIANRFYQKSAPICYKFKNPTELIPIKDEEWLNSPGEKGTVTFYDSARKRHILILPVTVGSIDSAIEGRYGINKPADIKEFITDSGLTGKEVKNPEGWNIFIRLVGNYQDKDDFIVSVSGDISFLTAGETMARSMQNIQCDNSD